jgi:hypothetical protein
MGLSAVRARVRENEEASWEAFFFCGIRGGNKKAFRGRSGCQGWQILHPWVKPSLGLPCSCAHWRRASRSPEQILM